MNWLMALRHVARETRAGFQGGLADVQHVRADTSAPLTPEQQELLLTASSDRERAHVRAAWADPFGMAKRMREHAEKNRREDQAAEEWLEDASAWMPGLRELSPVGDRPLVEFKSWMTRDHAWLAEDGIWPQGIWDAERELIEERWREHVERIREQDEHGL